eukprot:6189973-Pleurochrysis_carterae.AAC.6
MVKEKAFFIMYVSCGRRATPRSTPPELYPAKHVTEKKVTKIEGDTREMQSLAVRKNSQAHNEQTADSLKLTLGRVSEHRPINWRVLRAVTGVLAYVLGSVQNGLVFERH